MQQIFDEAEWHAYTERRWRLRPCATLSSAMAMLRQEPIPIVICESELPPHSWKDLLAGLDCLSYPPFLIVTSRLADGRLWAEALNLGAYDVLAQPFDHAEVARIVSLAWLHWTGPAEASAAPVETCAAAGG